MPNSLLRRKYDATFALWMMFLLGRHAMLGHDPPMYLRSTTATRFPSAANIQPAIVDPVPPPRITKSNSSGCVSLDVWADEAFSLHIHATFPFCAVSFRRINERSLSWLLAISTYSSKGVGMVGSPERPARLRALNIGPWAACVRANAENPR